MKRKKEEESEEQQKKNKVPDEGGVKWRSTGRRERRCWKG